MDQSSSQNKIDSLEGMPPLDWREKRKRRRERVAIAFLLLLFLGLTVAEFKLTQVASSLPFVNSIFFFGLLNLNIVLLVCLVWLVFRNIGKLFIERRRKILGSRLKTKLVVAFLAFSIIPTLLLFVISALYINSSFDKWFSLKIQNTLQASLEITENYYVNTRRRAMHFSEHLARSVGSRIESGSSSLEEPPWLKEYLRSQQELLALDSVEYYLDPIGERIVFQREPFHQSNHAYPRPPLDKLIKAFSGELLPQVQHMGTGDLIRCLVPVRESANATGKIMGVIAVGAYIPVSLVNKVDELSRVVDDYKETNPLKYPMKTAYLIILVLITLVIIFVAMWSGLLMAKELTVPVERLVQGVDKVGAGNLDVLITASGHDEISVLVNSFNKMTLDLRENRARLNDATANLESRRLQLEAILAHIGTGVIAVDHLGKVTAFNLAASSLLGKSPSEVLFKHYHEALQGNLQAIMKVIDCAFEAMKNNLNAPILDQWNFQALNSIKILTALATPLREQGMQWGVVVVIDDMTPVIKGQREMAWREVARRIAHEIKNPLTPIKLSAQRLQRRLSHLKDRDNALLKECTDTIVRNTDELKEMVNEFSNFARLPEINIAAHDLNQMIHEVVLLFQQAHSKIEFQMMFEKKVPIFDFDKDQMKRVIINLIDNAVAALQSDQGPVSKKIKIATHFHNELQLAAIEIEDNGPGMNEEIKTRIFEPYFSTKEEGTGLGLAIVKRIVNDHDGFIRVQSEPRHGARFLIELPTANKNLYHRMTFERNIIISEPEVGKE